MTFEFKVTTWERVTVDKDVEDEVFQAIKDNIISSSDELFDYLYRNSTRENTPYSDMDILIDSNEQMSLSENEWNATIEVRDKFNVLWDNAELDQ